jgi:hypothetical protein
MRGLVLVGALGVALLAAGAASAQSNVAGRWHVVGTINDGLNHFQATPTCAFILSGAQLGGTCIGPNGRGPIEGTVSGRSITWTWSHHATNAFGATGITGFEGTVINAGLIRGVMTFSGSPASGRFTASR